MVRRWVLIGSGELAAQLRQVIREVGLPRPDVRLCRCMVCNGDIVRVAKRDAVMHVPPFVAKTQERFFRCTRCGRHYWAGTHVERMRERLEGMLARGV